MQYTKDKSILVIPNTYSRGLWSECVCKVVEIVQIFALLSQCVIFRGAVSPLQPCSTGYISSWGQGFKANSQFTEIYIS